MPLSEPALKKFGSNVRNRRDALDLSQEQLAERADLDRTYVSGIEHGVRCVDQKMTDGNMSQRCRSEGKYSRTLFLKYSRAMSGQELFLRQHRVTGKQQGVAFVGCETLRHGTLRQGRLQLPRKQEPETGIEADQTNVEGGVMQSRETQAVSDIKSLRFVLTPRQNVRGDEKLPNRESRHPTASAKIIQHGLPKILLPTPHLYSRCHLSWPHRRTFSNSNAFLRRDLDLFCFISIEQFPECFFARRRGLGEAAVKFTPSTPIKRAGTTEPLYSAHLQRRIERRKIAELHRYTVRTAIHFLGQCDNRRLSSVHLAECQLVIKIQRDQEFVTRPASSGRHPTNMLLPS